MMIDARILMFGAEGLALTQRSPLVRCRRGGTKDPRVLFPNETRGASGRSHPYPHTGQLLTPGVPQIFLGATLALIFFGFLPGYLIGRPCRNCDNSNPAHICVHV